VTTREFSAQEAEAFFSKLFRGKHHIPGKLRRDGSASWSVGNVNPMSTFDSDELTRLVFLAHEHALRVEVLPSGPRCLRIAATKRCRLEDAPSWPLVEGHPTLDQAVGKFRERTP
jgi:hypothetical protein